MQTLFKKLEHCFLVESTKIEKTTLLYKAGLAEDSVKTNWILSKKTSYHKERSFASNYFICVKILFQFKNLV